MINVVLDFETRSRLDLRSTNSYKYARHSSTEVLCCSYSIDGGEVEIWKPGEPFPFEDFWPDFHILAFNAEFELNIWNEVCTEPEYDWPYLDPVQIECLQARASYAGWPRKLDTVCAALGMGSQGKDAAGHLNMLRLTKPVGAKLIGCEYIGGKFDADESRHERNYEYCRQDTSAENMVHRIAPPLPRAEQELWRVHQEINVRGVPVDTDLCRNAVNLVEKEKQRLCRELEELTDWQVRTPNCIKAFQKWAQTAGFALDDMREETVDWAIAGGNGNAPLKVRKALAIRKLYRDAAVAKYQAMLDHVESDGRCRGAHVFYKAGPGRWAGAGVQFQNLRRLVEDDVVDNLDWAEAISEAGDGDLLEISEELEHSEKGVIPTLGGMVRMAVCARPGKKLVVCDYSSIEMRMLHWLAGDTRTLKTIEDFDKGVGADPYVIAAATIFNKKVADVTKAERQTGKVQILGCGYMTGAQKFATFCAQYKIDMPLDRAQEIVQMYRRSFPLVKKFWYDVGHCAVKAVTTGKCRGVGHITFFMEGHTLNARLPSGRLMKYYDATVVDGQYGPEIEAMDQRSGGRRAVGLPILVENLDQGAARDLLADALVGCSWIKLPVVLHVHDEIVIEVDENDNESPGTLRDIMRSKPNWAKGLPVDAKLGEGRRYVK